LQFYTGISTLVETISMNDIREITWQLPLQAFWSTLSSYAKCPRHGKGAKSDLDTFL
jgi:hypothetical protein